MADDSFQEKSEAPTPKRREDAHRKGQVAKSTEVMTAMLLLTGAAVVHMASASLGTMAATVFRVSTATAAAPPAGVEAVAEWLRMIVGWGLAALAPPMLAVLAVGLLTGGVQARGILTLKPLQPDFKRISPAKNIKNLVGIKPVAELAKSLFKLLIVGVAVWSALRHARGELLALPQMSAVSFVLVLRRYVVRLLLTAGLAYLALAAADYLFQLWQFEKNLKMSREDVKREHKDTEGDLMVRARLRSMGRSLARRRMLAEVATADVVVTNPTHIACALKYDPLVAPAPVVVALGQRKIAERIKKLAHEAGVPVIENRPLARALLKLGAVGRPIPAELFVAVAEVLAFVMRGRRAAGAGAGAGATDQVLR
jgi:flagellar biosynthesis protein FlhB